MKRIASQIIELCDLSTIDEAWATDFLKKAGVATGNVASNLGKSAWSGIKDVAKDAAFRMTASVLGSEELAASLVGKVKEALPSFGSMSNLVNGFIKLLVQYKFMGSFKNEDAMVSAISSTFANYTASNPAISNGNVNDITFKRFVTSLFYFAAESKFSNVSSVPAKVSVVDYARELDARVINSPVVKAGSSFDAFDMSKVSESKLEDEVKSLVSEEVGSGGEITDVRVRVTGGNVYVSKGKMSGVGDSELNVQVMVVYRDSKKKIQTKISTLDGGYSVLDEEDVPEIPVEQFRDIINAYGVSPANCSILVRYAQKPQQKNIPLSRWVEVNVFGKSNTSYRSVLVHEDVQSLLEGSGGVLNADALLGSLPYYLASVGLINSISDSKTGEVFFDFTPVLSLSKPMSEGMVTGTFSLLDKFREPSPPKPTQPTKTP